VLDKRKSAAALLRRKIQMAKKKRSGSQRLEFGSMRIEPMSHGEAEQCDFVVCALEGYFPDDVPAACSRCRRSIVHRPHIPKGPPKICEICWREMIKGQDVTFGTTATVMSEVLDFLAKGRKGKA
jgi:hypothetical protein